MAQHLFLAEDLPLGALDVTAWPWIIRQSDSVKQCWIMQHGKRRGIGLVSQHELNATAMDIALDTFRKHNRSAGKDCAIESANLSKTRRKILMNAMADTSIQSRAIATVVKEEWGIDTITIAVIKHHRGGRCRTCIEAD